MSGILETVVCTMKYCTVDSIANDKWRESYKDSLYNVRLRIIPARIFVPARINKEHEENPFPHLNIRLISRTFP